MTPGDSRLTWKKSQSHLPSAVKKATVGRASGSYRRGDKYGASWQAEVQAAHPLFACVKWGTTIVMPRAFMQCK